MQSLATQVLCAPLGKTHLFSTGQAGFIVKSASGFFFGIDLYLSDCVERIEGHDGFHRLLPKLLSPTDIEFDCIVATHPHFDHFDMDSILQMMNNPRTRLFASTNCRKEVERLKMLPRNISYVRPGDTSSVGDFHLQFTSCDHGMGAPDAVGLLLTVDNVRFFFTGDTCLHLDRVDEFLSLGKIDCLVAPINGAFGNLNELECAQLADRIKPCITIPCHYGMFASHGGSPGVFISYMKRNIPSLKYQILTQGEKITF